MQKLSFNGQKYIEIFVLADSNNILKLSIQGASTPTLPKCHHLKCEYLETKSTNQEWISGEEKKEKNNEIKSNKIKKIINF